MKNFQYFAQINDENMVIYVAAVHEDFLIANPDRYAGVWVETFFELPNKTYASVGMIYDQTTKDFTLAPPAVYP